MKKILVPADFSHNAYAALHYATQLFKEEKCQFYLLHSFEHQKSRLDGRITFEKKGSKFAKLYDESESKLKALVHRIHSDAPNDLHKFKPISSAHALTTEINKVIKQRVIDFVCIGSKGVTAAQNIFLGSNTLSIIKKISGAPLIIVPQQIEYEPVAKIAFTTGFKRDYQATEMEALQYISKLTSAPVHILHIRNEESMSDAQREHFHQLFHLLTDVHRESSSVSDESVHKGIINFVEEEKVQLLALIYYKDNPILSIFREDVIKNIAKHITIPFLIIPAEEQ